MHIDCFGVFHLGLAVLADFSACVLYYYIFLLIGLEPVIK